MDILAFHLWLADKLHTRTQMMLCLQGSVHSGIYYTIDGMSQKTHDNDFHSSSAPSKDMELWCQLQITWKPLGQVILWHYQPKAIGKESYLCLKYRERAP